MNAPSQRGITRETNIAAELVDIGENRPFPMADGSALRFMITGDDFATVDDDGDWFGEIAPVTYRDYVHHDPRPNGFDGRARIIRPGQGRDTYWWQPPSDITDDYLPTLERSLVEILERGYYSVTLERTHESDAYGRPIVVGFASLGMVDPSTVDDSDALADVLADLVAEVLAE